MINALIGIFCIVTANRYKDADKIVNPEPPAADKEQTDQNKSGQFPAVLVGALVIFAVSGFAAMAYEVIWAKLLGLLVGPTTYSFTIVLVTFILGLALGSMIFGWLGDRVKNVIGLLIGTQIVAALLALLISQLLGDSQILFSKLIFHFKDNFVFLSFLKAVVLFIFMLLPTLCLGATFPLVGKIYTQSIKKVGQSIGFAYAINTIGAVLGSFCAGFILIPFLGKETGLSLVVAIQIFAALLIGLIIHVKNNRAIWRIIPLAVPAAAGLVLCLYMPSWNRQTLSIGRYQRFEEFSTDLNSISWFDSLFKARAFISESDIGDLMFYGDGIGGFTTVTRYADAFGNYNYILINGGKPDASSRSDMQTQTLSAHFPMIFHKDPKKVMVLGLASGVTAGEVLHYPVEQLDILEISDQVVEGSNFFRPWNNNVLSDPRTNLIIQDGRAHLNLTDTDYDVIISEPSNPWMAGLASLFTHDMFLLAKNKLNKDGIYLQFIHSYQMDWTTFALVGRTFKTVFDNSLMLVTAPSGMGYDYLLVGFNGDEGLKLENGLKNIAYARESGNVTITDPRLLYRFIITEDLGLFEEGPINTDSRPHLEFSAPKLIFRDDPAIVKNLNKDAVLNNSTLDLVDTVKNDTDLQIDFAAYAYSIFRPLPGDVNLKRADDTQKDRFLKLIHEYCANNPAYIYDFGSSELYKRCLSAQIESLNSRIDNVPDKALSHSYLGNLYYDEGSFQKSAEIYKKQSILNPDDAVVFHNIGLALYRLGNYKEAISNFMESIRLDPEYASAYNALGYVYLVSGDFDKAIEQLQSAIEHDPALSTARQNLDYAIEMKNKVIETSSKAPDQKEAIDDPDFYHIRGVALVQKGELREGIEFLRKAIGMKADWPDAMNSLAWILACHTEENYGAPEEALQLAERAHELTNYDRPDIMDTLSVAYAANGRFTEAIELGEKVLEKLKSSGQTQVIDQIKERIELFKQDKPYIEEIPEAG